MRRVEWTDDAYAQLEEYLDYLGEIRPELAARAFEDILANARRLGRFPYMARPGRRPGTRERSILKWSKVLVYRVFEDRVQILSIFDPRRND